MIRQQFFVEHYWKVIVWWNADYDFFDVIYRDLKAEGCSDHGIKNLYEMMSSGKAKAVTFSNLLTHHSVLIFNYHTSIKDYLDSVVHEAEHIKQAMLEVYQVEDKGEPPAYTVGYLVGRMWEVFRDFVCITCKHT